MIGNKHLQSLFAYSDEDTALNQLLELIKSKDEQFIKSLGTPVEINLCNEAELKYLTKVSPLIDYYLQIQGIEVPNWLRDEKLKFDKPYYFPKRISDFEKLKLQYTNPSPFRAKNVYYDLSGIERV
ncbi:hypothetical protein [Lentibacillus sp. Marseille-P4043]|uniref:hypothetical protein n=1 Tax=Lentibacillus sp. Marseille-P4043 TaxID=2040293 RepID=UPI000D0BB98E|nr:hypothetical protein [Lentibacillus sp. Marseille-P4043]